MQYAITVNACDGNLMSVEASPVKLPFSVAVSRRTGPLQGTPGGILYVVRDRTHPPEGQVARYAGVRRLSS